MREQYREGGVVVFVEFVARKHPQHGALHHFVGPSLDDVLATTNGGKQFSIVEFISYREITASEARRLGLQLAKEDTGATGSVPLAGERHVGVDNLEPLGGFIRRGS